MTDLVVHHLGRSQSERIVWLCEELGLAYDMVRYDREAGMAPAAYRALHPMGIAPVVAVDGLVLAESGAIVDYLVMKHGGGRLTLAPGHPRFADWLFWFHFANATLLPVTLIGLIARAMGTEDSPMATLGGRDERGMALLEAGLATDRWIAGDTFTTADIMMVFPLTTMRAFAPRDLGPFPATRGYLARIGARPAYARAMAKCEPGFVPMLG